MRKLFSDLRSQSGIALIMAIGILGVLSLTAASLVYYSSSNTREASRSGKSEAALNLAEGGINQALAVLNDEDNNALYSQLLDSNPVTTAIDTFSSTFENGTATWSGSLDYQNMTWTITSVGQVANPTGAADIRRTYTAKVGVILSPTGVLNNLAWNYIFATRTGDPDGCDMYVKNNVDGGTRLYVRGNLCIKNNVSVISSPIVVKGSIHVENNANIGSAGSRVEAYVGGDSSGYFCKYANQHWHPDASHGSHENCSDTDNVYSHLPGVGTAGVSYSPPDLTPPTTDMDSWYQAAIPGPAVNCTSTTGAVSGTPPTFDNNYPLRDGSVATIFDLTAATSYTCRVGPAGSPAGELSWDATTRTMTVNGTMFIDGSVTMNNGLLNSYNGQGTLYLSGTFLIGNNTKMCGAISGTECAISGEGGWNPNTEMFVIVADGSGAPQLDTGYSVLFSQNSQWQGGIYATGSVQFENNAKTDGPLMADTVDLINNVYADTFPLVTTVPAGIPGNPNVYAQPLTPQLFPN